MHGLTVDAGIERANVILIPVNVQLWFCTVGAPRLVAKDLELFGRYRGVEVLNCIACAEFLRRIAIGTGTVLRGKVVKVVWIADFGVIDVEAPHLIHDASMLPVVQPTVAIALSRVFIFINFI
ncbi:hypothetical protein D3C72_1342830 [compost metagenome]